MNDLAREALGRVIRTYGTGICHTPRSCEMFIRQECGPFPDESKALIEALRQGVTTDISKYQPVDNSWDEFAGQLSTKLKRTGLDDQEGAWAVDAWARVLGRHPETYRPAPKVEAPRHVDPDAPVPVPNAVKVAMTLIVGAGGALGGAIGSILVPGVLLITSAAVDMPLYKQLRFGSPRDIWLVVLVVLFVLGMFGAVAGFVGGAGGWLFGRGDRGHWNAFCTACGAAFATGALCSYFCGIFGSTIGAFTAAFGAATTTARRGGMA